MSEKDIIYIKNGKQKLKTIFKLNSSINYEYAPIFENSTKIPSLFNFLKNKDNNILEKIEILRNLYNLFSENTSLVLFFMKKNSFGTYNFYELLIDLYLTQGISNDNKELIEKIIFLLKKNITLTKFPFHYLCQKLSIYFNNVDENEELELLDENKMLSYLRLFNIFYLNENNEENNITQNDITKKEIKNFIYLNGLGSGISLSLNKNSINPNSDFPSLRFGLSFIMWIYIDSNLIQKIKEFNQYLEITLVKIVFSESEIKLILKDLSSFQVCLNKEEQKTIQNNLFKVNDWNNIIFSIYELNKTRLPIKIFVNSVELNTFLDIPKKLGLYTKIDSIRLFDNFIGKVSSFMMMTKGIEAVEANYFSNEIKYGFYKNKILFNFIYNNENDYFDNCNDYKYFKKYKWSDLNKSYNFQHSKLNIKNLFAIFCPFAYDFNNDQLDDIFGNFIGPLEINDCANNYKNHNKNISKIGGIKNLLPILELMYSTISSYKTINHKYIDNSILSPNTFHEYLNLIKNIIKIHYRNFEDAMKNYFFTSLSIFLQQLPSEFIDEQSFEILIDIGKETLKYRNIMNLNEDNFVDVILLNEKILMNYGVQQRMILWKILHSFICGDSTLIKVIFKLRKICFLLRFFGAQKCGKYCCKKHCEILNVEDIDNKILEPSMMERTRELFLIIQIYINKYCDEEDTIYLLKLLSFDISPCLQERIIDVYYNYFSDENIDAQTKIKNFKFLLKNNFIELLEYVYSISLFNIKGKILSLFKILFENEVLKENLRNHLNNDVKLINNFFNFISEDILPGQTYIKTDNDNSNVNEILCNDKTLQINNFFDKKVYEKETKYILTCLFEWVLCKVPSSSNLENNFKINKFILNFLFTFASKCSVNYVGLLLVYLYSNFTGNIILNKKILYSESQLYYWLIDTIFHFYNSEIVKQNEYKKDDISIIKNHSLLLFKNCFAEKRSHAEFKKELDYLIRYSIYLRTIFGDKDDKKNQEVTRITRLLFETIKELPSINMNYKAKYFFLFMIYHKNFKSLTGIDNDINAQISSHNITRTINNIKLNNKIISEEKKENIKSKNNEELDKKNGNLNLKKVENSFKLKKDDSEKNLNKKKDNIYVSDFYDIIPDYIFDGLHLKKINSDMNTKDSDENSLQNYWEDFSLYKSIIDYYSLNLWSDENLRKNVGIELDGDILEHIENMIKEYGENKLHRNVLLNQILKYLTIKYSNKENYKSYISINIFYIYVILLSIALVLTKNIHEKKILEGKFIQFFVFCVLAGININSNEIYYNLIQDVIYNTLGYACIFMKKLNKKKYKELTEKLILPILKKEKIKRPKILLIKKEPINAIFRLFELIQKNNTSPDDIDFSGSDNVEDLQIKIQEMTKRNYTIFVQPKKFKIKNIFHIKNIDYKVEFKGDYNEILKNVFSINKLENIKKESKINYEFKSYYKSEYNEQSFSQNIINEEKLRINLVIKKILLSYESDIVIYGNSKFLEEKTKRMRYKKNKANLFSWNGFWSNKYLFLEHSELLKWKTKNHYTSEMIKPLLVSILDFEYYTPPFKSFNKNELFNKNNYNYKINLDIDSILSKENNEEKTENPINKIITNEEDNEPTLIKNKYGFSYAEYVYRYSYDGIWDFYQNYYKKNDNYKNLIISGKQFKTKIINEKNKVSSFKCCKVKLTHHITGYIYPEDENILFEPFPFSKEEFENNINFDSDMGCCFGSIFIHKKSDKDKIHTTIKYNEIKYIFIRTYFYMETALEFFTNRNKSYLFNFKSNNDLIKFKTILLEKWQSIEIKSEFKQVIGYEKKNPNLKKKYIMVNKKNEDWVNNNISTMEYLMWLNIYSGRSFNDLTKYPIFPWILMNYSEEKKEDIQYRDLSLPMGMVEFGENSVRRKEDFIQVYETLKADLIDKFPDFDYEDYLSKGAEYYKTYKLKKIKEKKESQDEENIIELNRIPYMYGSHYSNPTYVSHYLVRIFPFSFTSIEIQGQQFDDPDRIFTSMYKTFDCSTSLKTDVRELIPEFYFLPEFLLNDNNLNLGQNKVNTKNELFLINDVKLPLWSNNNSVNFVLELKRNLESSNITNNISNWTDLIFGLNQKGENAEENYNIFLAHTYDKMVDIEKITDPNIRNSLMRLYETGVTPIQIFEHEIKSKVNYHNNLITLDEGKNFVVKFIRSNKFSSLKSQNYENHKYSRDQSYKEENLKISHLKIIKIIPLDNLSIRIITNQGYFYDIKIEDDNSTKNNMLKIVENPNPFYEYKNNSTKFACSYSMSKIDTPLTVYKNQFLIKGGFWDGRLEINNLFSEKTQDINEQGQTYFDSYFSPITIIECSKEQPILFCGTFEGILYIYELKSNSLKLLKTLNLFEDEITSISINDTLNMFCVSSKDGFINLFILPSLDLVRIINLNKNDNSKNKKQNMIYANNIFLSNFPLPCIVSYINSKKAFISYTINGKFINEIKENNNSYIIKSPIIYKANNFEDILIYGTNDGLIKLRKFPEMLLINSIEVFPNKVINEICISQDKKYCYVWSSGNIIALVKVVDVRKNK